MGMQIQKDCYLGEKLFNFLIHQQRWEEKAALDFLENLISQNYVKSVSASQGAINYTEFIKNNYYQWKKIALDLTNEPEYKVVFREARRMGYTYVKMARELELLRLSINFEMHEYLQLVQPILSQHIHLFRDSISIMLDSEEKTINAVKKMKSSVGIFLETLDPLKETRKVFESDQTGIKPSPTFVIKVFPKVEFKQVFIC